MEARQSIDPRMLVFLSPLPRRIARSRRIQAQNRDVFGRLMAMNSDLQEKERGVWSGERAITSRILGSGVYVVELIPIGEFEDGHIRPLRLLL